MHFFFFFFFARQRRSKFEPGHSISETIACAPSKDTDQSVHLRSLKRVFAGRSVYRQGSLSAVRQGTH